MILIAALTCLALSSAPSNAGATPLGPAAARRASQGDDAPTAQEVAEQLRAAFDGSSSSLKILALRASALHPDAAVVTQARRGLGDRDVEVRLAAFDALGRNAHAQAFEALLAHYDARRKQLRSLERDLPALLVALARRGDPRALRVLTDDVQAQRLVPTLRARLLGLGRIRTKSAIENLMKLADEIGFVDMHNHLEDFRLALVVLSGVDHGRSLDAWRAWWRGVESEFTPPEKLPALDARDAARWSEFWRDAPLERN